MRGKELSNGHCWPANNHDLVCVSLGHTAARWPSKLSQFFFLFVPNWNMPQRVKDCNFSLHSWIYCFLSTIYDGPVSHHPWGCWVGSRKFSLNTKHQVFSAVYLHFFSLLILVCTTCKLDEGYSKNIFNNWNLTFPSNDLEQITYSLIMTKWFLLRCQEKVCSSIWTVLIYRDGLHDANNEFFLN